MSNVQDADRIAAGLDRLAEAVNDTTVREAVRAFQDELRRTEQIELTLTYEKPFIVLSKLVVPKEQRGVGRGTAIMKRITQIADEHKLPIALTPVVDFGASSAKRLQQFYKRFGFQMNQGRHKDFSTRERMIRPPQP